MTTSYYPREILLYGSLCLLLFWYVLLSENLISLFQRLIVQMETCSKSSNSQLIQWSKSTLFKYQTNCCGLVLSQYSYISLLFMWVSFCWGTTTTTTLLSLWSDFILSSLAATFLTITPYANLLFGIGCLLS